MLASEKPTIVSKSMSHSKSLHYIKPGKKKSKNEKLLFSKIGANNYNILKKN